MHGAIFSSRVALALAVSLSGTSASGEDSGPSAGTITSDVIAATASGGTPGYSYAWSKLGGSAKISALNPSSAATAFQGTGMIGGETAEATFQLRVTDSLGAFIDSAVVTVSIHRGTGSGSG